jgi:two-component system CheB/CheR fusion protein
VTVESQIEMVTLEGRRLAIETTWDITERKAWDSRQRLLLSELTHRVKNTLTVVQSIASQTLRHTSSSGSFVEQFEGRLVALANSHKLLVESEWEGAELGDLVRLQLAAHGSGEGDRISVEGPLTILPPELATPFGLLLHELATNAAKYGALSVDQGRISVSWTLSNDGTESELRLVWKETNGPTVAAPTRSGFGTILITRGLPNAVVDHDFHHAGLICTIRLVIDRSVKDVLEKSLNANR